MSDHPIIEKNRDSVEIAIPEAPPVSLYADGRIAVNGEIVCSSAELVAALGEWILFVRNDVRASERALIADWLQKQCDDMVHNYDHAAHALQYCADQVGKGAHRVK